MKIKDCPRCGEPEGLMKCPACTKEYATGVNPRLVEADAVETRRQSALVRLARELADCRDDRSWAKQSKIAKDKWVERARAFVAECVAESRPRRGESDA